MNVAVVGNTSTRKTSLINYMNKYPLFEFEEYPLRAENTKNHDYYIFTVDAANDINQQVDAINTGIPNSLITVLKTDATPLKNDEQLLNKKTFYFSQYDLNAEKTVFDLLSFIVESKMFSMSKELKNIKKLLDDSGYFKLCSEDRNKIIGIYHLFLESINKNLINKLINQMGEMNSEELVELFPFQEIYNSQTENNKNILRKIISYKCKPHFIPSFNKYFEY